MSNKGGIFQSSVELKKSAMAFQLKNSDTIIWISKEDCSEIATKIICQGLVKGDYNIIFRKDTSVTRAQELHDILNKEKGMPPELRIQYYQEILNLYKSAGETIDELFTPTSLTQTPTP